jgi:Rrf2 family protein
VSPSGASPKGVDKSPKNGIILIVDRELGEYMLIGKKGYYYIKILLFFAYSGETPFSIKVISERLGISEKVMEQVLLVLKNAGFLTSKRGPQGGYSLAQDPLELTIIDILEKTGQRIDILPPDIKGKVNAIDDVLLEAGEMAKNEIHKGLKKLTIKSLRKKMGEKVTETGFNYVI